MERNIEPRLYFSSLPKLSTLVAFRATSSVKNCTSIQPLCCRELLFTIPEILVSPAFDDKSSLFIITEQCFSDTKSFLVMLDDLKVKLHSRLEVDCELFQLCFTYTLIQKLAPFWNKIENMFIQGGQVWPENKHFKVYIKVLLDKRSCRRDFLQSCSKLPALNFEISVTNKICLAVQPLLIKMPPAQMEDFMIDFKPLWTFKRNPEFSISRASIQHPRCYVLPSFKKGFIQSITHRIPSHAPFDSYEDMRQHWKLTYGFRLPPDNCQLYYNVSFFGNAVFSYPEWCIRNNEPTHYLRCDQDEICRSFLNDIVGRMPKLFTNKLQFTSESLYWQKQLPVADNGNKSCLAKNPQINQNKLTSQFQSKQNAALTCSERMKPFQFIKDKSTDKIRKFQDVKEHMNAVNNTITDIRSNKQNKIRTNFTKSTNLYNFHDDNSLSVDDINNKSNIIEIPDSPFFEQIVPDEILEFEKTFGLNKNSEIIKTDLTVNVIKNINNDKDNAVITNEIPEVEVTNNEVKNCVSSNVIKEVKFVRREITTDSVVPDMLSDIQENIDFSSERKIIPCFKKIKKNKINKSVLKTTATFSQSANTNQTVPDIVVQSSLSSIKPNFSLKNKTCNMKISGVKTNTKVIKKDGISHVHSTDDSVTRKKFEEDPEVFMAHKNINTFLPKPKKIPKRIAIISKPISNSPSHVSSTEKSYVSSTKASLLSTPIPLKERPNSPKSYSSAGINLAKEILSQLSANPGCPNSPCQSSQQLQIPDSTVVEKKQRAKPKVQDVDVEVMAHNKMLKKVNALTLKTWLKNKGILCKSSEKKEDLVKKVLVFLGLFQEELKEHIKDFIQPLPSTDLMQH